MQSLTEHREHKLPDMGKDTILGLWDEDRFDPGAAEGINRMAIHRPAEKQANKKTKDRMSAEVDVTKLLHQLQEYQVKLEMANRRLTFSEERARQAIEASNAAMWDYDLTSGEVYLSEAWETFLGGKRKPTKTTIQDLTELVPEEDRQMVRDAIIQAIRVGGSSVYHINHRVRKPGGGLIWVHSRGRVVERSPDGRTQRMIGVTFDITDRIEAETRLKADEQRFRALFESAADYALVLELQASGPPIIVDGNQAFFKKHGYARKELIGQPVSLVETTTSASHIKEREELVKNGKSVHFEVEHVCKDGSTFFAAAVVRLVEGQESNLVYSVERDTTMRRRAEKEQQRLLVENRKLLQQLIRVQEKERRSLARDLHDELGQLLTGIDARAEYILKHTDDDELRAVAKEIIRDTKASFDASHSTLIRLRPMTLDTLGLTAALTELTSSAKKKMGMDCALQIDGDIDHLDDMRAITIYRLVQEALSNSHRHGRADRAEVIIKYVPPLRRQNGQVWIKINDNGRNHNGRGISEGMGIIGMRERVHALGGIFKLEPVFHDGVHIEVILPLSDERNR